MHPRMTGMHNSMSRSVYVKKTYNNFSKLSLDILFREAKQRNWRTSEIIITHLQCSKIHQSFPFPKRWCLVTSKVLGNKLLIWKAVPRLATLPTPSPWRERSSWQPWQQPRPVATGAVWLNLPCGCFHLSSCGNCHGNFVVVGPSRRPLATRYPGPDLLPAKQQTVKQGKHSCMGCTYLYNHFGTIVGFF